MDVFISTADPEKEPPLVTANTILSVMACEYPVEKLSIYISDDGGAILTFEAMAEAVVFAEVRFCSHLLSTEIGLNLLKKNCEIGVMSFYDANQIK